MNTKNLDAIKRMVVRLQAIIDTENIDEGIAYSLSRCAELLDVAVYQLENDPKQNNTDQNNT